VQVILQDREYLRQKMDVSSSECKVDKNAQAFGNALLFLTLLDFNASQNTIFQADVFGEDAMPVLFSKCPIETGMMTDYPLLILDWKAVGWNPDEVAESLEFSTYTRQETDFLEQKIDQVMQQVPRETGDQFRIDNLYRNKKMKLATSLSEQARWLALGIAGITLTLSGIILFFSFLLLLEFKRVVIETFRLMGVSRLEVTFGFLLGGGILGVVVASVGLLLAWSGRLLIQVQGWIPFEHFFSEWPPMLFVAVFVLTPICVAVFSAFVARFRLPRQLNMSEMG
jgi:ABC-type antimicrobial peptide transport system permease subunit